MIPTKPPYSPNLEEFWTVFIPELPRIPTVDELICRIVAINYPQGIVTDINGADISPPMDAGIATEQILLAIQTALDLEKNFWIKQLREKRIYTPYAWALKLSSNVAIKEAETQIVGALGWVGNIQQLDALFWQAFRRTENMCNENGREIQWAPFGDYT
ncbi:hypothetical protein F4825DRAFT_441926 [Nemania diffusa]|nr:hypothetical protein F4825DRAFT_441926 [Nemania diffusa]